MLTGKTSNFSSVQSPLVQSPLVQSPFVEHMSSKLVQLHTNSENSSYTLEIVQFPQTMPMQIAIAPSITSTQLSTQLKFQAALQALTQFALSDIGFSDLCQTIVELIQEQINAEQSSLWAASSDGQSIHKVAGANRLTAQLQSELEATPETAAAPVLTIASQAWLAPLLSANHPTLIHPQSSAVPLEQMDCFVAVQSAESLALPITVQNANWGLLTVSAQNDRSFATDEIQFLQAIAQVLAGAIMRQRNQNLVQTKLHVLEKIALGGSLQEVFTHLCLLLEKQALGLNCTISLVDATAQHLILISAPSFSSEAVQALDNWKIADPSGSFGTAAQRQASIFVSDTSTDPLWQTFRDLAEKHKIRACWSIPFFKKSGELLGLLSIIHPHACEPTAHHHQIIETATYLACLATERSQASEQLEQQAFYDALTGLPNRIQFIEQLENRIQLVQQAADDPNNPFGFAVLFLDVDHFKLVNDSLGHSVGDRLLVEIARLVRRCIRSKDIFARLSGDEFAILIDEIEDVSQAQLIAERIRAVMSFPVNLGNQQVFTSVSVGIAHSSNGYQQAEDILRNADTAMYCAKALGRANYVIFDETMHTHALSRLQLEMDLRQAVEVMLLDQEAQLQVFYQPIVSLSKGIICGFEALLRWFHPQRGMISPVDFIPVAEETGLIVTIGRWVLSQACRQVCKWQEKMGLENLQISINVSSRQFFHSDFVTQIEQVLKETGIQKSCLKLEITESVLMETGGRVTDQLRYLQDMGVRLSLDDFGTGYSSLNYLYRFPINTLKVDRSFVDGLDSGQQQIVKTIIALAHGLSMDVTAEGVETKEQMEQLQALGCEYGQGYLFSPPVDLLKAEALLTESKNWLQM
jgi:diguanylate cyclase (GGDEF)-like protein